MSYVYEHGSGTAGDPYQVWTAADLDGVRDHLSSHFIQMANIDLGGWGNWIPIGMDDILCKCVYDGQNYVIDNMSISYNMDDGVYGLGLFNGAEAPAVFKNIVLNNVTVTGGYSDVAGLVGVCYRENEMAVKIYRCSVSGNVEGNNHVGLICGDYEGIYKNNPTEQIHQCYANGKITLSMDSWWNSPHTAGLLVGSLVTASMVDCYGKGEIVWTEPPEGHEQYEEYYEADIVGGLVGQTSLYLSHHEGMLKNCYAVVEVSGGIDVGPLIGNETKDPEYDIINCYYDSDVVGLYPDTAGEPRTTAEMTHPYIDFPANVYTDWFFCDNGVELLNDGYPLFIWQLPIWRHDIEHKVNDGYPYFCWQIPPPLLVSKCIPFLFRVPYLE